MHDDQQRQQKAHAKRLNAKARTLALTDLSKKYPLDFRLLYTIRKREVFAQAGMPLTRRATKHRDDGTGFCQVDGRLWPCPYIRRLQSKNE